MGTARRYNGGPRDWIKRTFKTSFSFNAEDSAAIIPGLTAHAGLTINYPPMGLPGQGIRIISSKEKPKNMSLAVKYRGYWFYIDETDQETKAVFMLLRTLWSINIAGSVDLRDSPVLTIPVSR